MSQLVLASTSPFRQQILRKLHLPFTIAAPDIDESPLPGESAQQLVARLSLEKAKAVASNHTDALIIGSDQVAVNGEQILGKPGDYTQALQQLTAASGRCVTFYTGLCLYNSKTQQHQLEVSPFHVHFRLLTTLQIEHYLEVEQPFNCAGSFKSEGYGITLFSRLEGDDPNSLIGLPLIRLTTMLENEGMAPL